MNQELTVRKSNAIIDAAFRMSKLEHIILLAGISQANSKEGLLNTDQFEVSVSTVATLLDRGNAYDDLSKACDRLFDRYVIIESAAEKIKKSLKETLKTRWVSSVKYQPESGRIVLRFAKDILPYISALEGYYSKYKLQQIASMQSSYGIRLFEMLLSWQLEEPFKEVELAWLRHKLQLDKDEYPRIFDFKKRVLAPAIADINNHTNLWVKIVYRKTGHAVTHLQFAFGKKDEAAKPQKIEKRISKDESRVFGVPRARIEREARPGETAEDVARLILTAARGTQADLNL